MEITVGFGRSDITPTIPQPLAGYGNECMRMHENVLDPLYASCIAITDEQDKTLLLFSLDLIKAMQGFVEPWAAAVSKATGVPEDYIFFSATHTHAAPMYYDCPQRQEALDDFHKQLLEQLPKAAQQAMQDRVSATMVAGRTDDLVRCNYVRHYLMNDGSVFGSNFGSLKSGIKGHMAEPDKQMQLVRFLREGKENILIMNWQAHPCLTGGYQVFNVSADYIGAVRSCIENATGDHFFFYYGAAGDTTVRSWDQTEEQYRDHKEYGERLTKEALAILPELQPIAAGPVKVSHTVHPGKVDHSEDHKVPDARKVVELFQSTGDRPAAVRLAVELGMHSPYHANSLILKSQMGELLDLPLAAASVGELGFAMASYEMFSTNGMFIKENAPQAMTLICTCTNGGYNYLPSAAAFDYGCYERDQCKHAKGIAEEAAQIMTDMLKQQYEEQ